MMDQVEARVVAVRVKWNRRATSNAQRFAGVVNRISESGWSIVRIRRDADQQMFCHRIEISEKGAP